MSELSLHVPSSKRKASIVIALSCLALSGIGGADSVVEKRTSIADQELFERELDLATTRGSEMRALAQLYRALGGGWQPEPTTAPPPPPPTTPTTP